MKKLEILALLSSITLAGCVFDSGPAVPTPDQIVDGNSNNANNENNVNNTNNTNNINNTNNVISEDCSATPIAASSAASSEFDYDIAPFDGGVVLSWAEEGSPRRLRSIRWTNAREITVFQGAVTTLLVSGEDSNFASASFDGQEVLYFGAQGNGLTMSLCPIDQSCSGSTYQATSDARFANASKVDLMWNDERFPIVAFGRHVDDTPEQVVAFRYDLEDRSFGELRGSMDMILNGAPAIAPLNPEPFTTLIAGRTFSDIRVTGDDEGTRIPVAVCELPDALSFVEERVQTISGEPRPFTLVRGPDESGARRTFVAQLRCGGDRMAPSPMSTVHENLVAWDVSRVGDTPAIVSSWVGDGDLWVQFRGPQNVMSEPFLLERDSDLVHVRVHAAPGRTIISGMTPEDGLVIWQFDGTPAEQSEALASCLDTTL